jgi:predicted transcriptional regulator
MARVPENNLTPVQFEIMQAAWDSQQGATVAEIWETISHTREVARTTVLNLVDRLEKRGWLARKKIGGVYRYQPTVARETAAAHVATEFVDAFFSGSASNLVMSLLGSKSISQDEIEELRAMLNTRRSETKKSKGTGK